MEKYNGFEDRKANIRLLDIFALDIPPLVDANSFTWTLQRRARKKLASLGQILKALRQPNVSDWHEGQTAKIQFSED